MTRKIVTLRGEKAQTLHNEIITEYNSLLELSEGKHKNKILDKIAKKFGYSSGQSVRNILNKYKVNNQIGI